MEIYPWALGSECWRSRIKEFLIKRNLFLERIKFRAVVSNRTCDEVWFNFVYFCSSCFCLSFVCLFIFTCFFYLLLFVYLSSGVFLIFFFESHENELLSLKENYTFQGFRESVFLTLEMLCYSNTHFPRYTQGIPVIPNPPSMAT